MDTGATPDFLEQTFLELGATDPASMTRAVLLKDRFFVGQRFRCEGFQAVWMAGGNTVEFYDKTGELLKTVCLEEADKKIAA